MRVEGYQICQCTVLKYVYEPARTCAATQHAYEAVLTRAYRGIRYATNPLFYARPANYKSYSVCQATRGATSGTNAARVQHPPPTRSLRDAQY
eukprot:951406-Rhodomonas_salina.5